MDRRLVERIRRAANAEKAGRLLKRAWSQPRDFHEILATLEWAVLAAKADDILGHAGIQSRDIRE